MFTDQRHLMTDFIQESLAFEEPDKGAALQSLTLIRPLVFFDLETTGLDFEQDRIIQFAFLKVMPDKQQSEWQELVNPGIAIPPEATRVHGIDDNQVKDKPGMDHFAPLICEFVSNCDLAGFNIARFDIPFLQAELKRHGCGLDLKKTQCVDAQAIFHRKEPRDLTAAYKFYCSKDLHGAHDAMQDVRATLNVLDAQLERYEDLDPTVQALNKFCSPPADDRWVTADRKFYWRHKQAVFSFGKFRGKTLKWVCENEKDYVLWLRDRDLEEETRDMLDVALKGSFPVPKRADNE
jgi:DNA polymerase-3 subunit epsilon